MIVHDGDANLPARIYSFECIGLWSRVTAKPGNEQARACWVNTVDGMDYRLPGWMEVSVAGPEGSGRERF